MTNQSEALRLADRLSTGVIDREGSDTLAAAAAAELRRLVAQRDQLLEACKRALRYSENVARAEGVLFDDDNDLPAIEFAIRAVEE